MVDSDDEYDRKRRDKFRGERSAGDNFRSDRRDERRGREDWMERGRGRPDYYRGGIRDRYSPGRDLPPPKRMRPGPDWSEDNRPRYGTHEAYGIYNWGGHDPYSVHSMHGFSAGGGGGTGASLHATIPPVHSRDVQNTSDIQTQPPMLTLKQFLDTQDDGISDADVVRKYSEYKLEFKRQQLNEFFVAHKDEEWFKNKYHPEESQKRKEEQFNFLKKRVNVFVELLEKGSITNVSVDVSQADQLLKLLDTVVIKLEGGTEDDLKVLDENPLLLTEITKTFDVTNTSSTKNIKEHDDGDVIITCVKSKIKQEQLQEMSWEPIPLKIKKHNKTESDDEENWDNDDDNNFVKKDNKNDEKDNWEFENEKFKINDKLAEDDDNWDDDNSENISHQTKKSAEDEEEDKKSESNNDLVKLKEDSSKKLSRGIDEEGGGEHAWDDENSNESQKKSLPRKHRTSSESSSASSQGSQKNNEIDAEAQIGKKDEDKNDLSEEKVLDSSSSKERMEKNQEDTVHTETIDLDIVKESDINETIKPRALHRTSSIFLRNLAPAITKAEIETICRRYDGFLRVAIADPLVERRWFRRGWVTFQRDVNIKEICWNLNNIRLRDCEMGAIVNRDLSRRVRPVNGITAHKAIVRSDIKLLAKIALNLDDKFDLWGEKLNAENNSENGDVTKRKSFGFKSRNPVLQNITDYLIEEASAEEDELLGLSSENTSNEGEILDRDPQLIQVLDKLILYMRIVHSLDYYNHCEYPYEDEMPNRCGIIHARGPPPTNKITKQDIEDYIKNFETKMSSFLAKSAKVDEEELKNLGCKDSDAEVEKFVQANTQEISKDKWLCPLSGKKFKGPEFIRKHIFNKHMEKVEEVRKEVEYFNNYLKDPKRPQLPEHPGNTKRSQSISDAGGSQIYRPGFHTAAAYTSPYAAYAPPIIAPPRPRVFGNRRMPGINHRTIIQYRDLDAPDESIDSL